MHAPAARIEAASAVYGQFAENFGVSLTKTECYEALFRVRAYRTLDDMIDGAQDIEAGLAEYRYNLGAIAINAPEKFTVDPDHRMADLAERFVTWEGDYRHDQLFHFEALGQISANKRRVKTAKALCGLSILEARHMATAYLPHRINPETGEERDTDNFDNFLTDAFIAAYLLDSAIDLRTDYEEGTLQVPPTTLNQAYLFARAVPYGLRSIERIPPDSAKNLGVITSGALLQVTDRSPAVKLGRA